MSTKPTNPLRTYQIFFAALGVVCVAAIALNLAVRRGPVHDATAVEDLRSISGSIDQYVSQQPQLPPTLSDLIGLSKATRQRLKDYEYVPGQLYSYQLCATFVAASEKPNVAYGPEYTGPDPGTHAAGRQCFTYNAASQAPGSGAMPLPMKR